MAGFSLSLTLVVFILSGTSFSFRLLTCAGFRSSGGPRYSSFIMWPSLGFSTGSLAPPDNV